MKLILYVLSLFAFAPRDDDALVRRLGSEDFATRAAADDALRAKGWGAKDCLRRGLAHPDPEVRHRAAALYQQALSGVIDSLGPLPEIDAAWWDEGAGWYRRGFLWGLPHDRLSPYLHRVGRDGYPYANYYLATRLWLVDELESGTPVWVLRPVLAEMRRRDEIFLRDFPGKAVAPGD